MYCSNCGNEISDKAFVCPKCGAKIGASGYQAPVSGGTGGSAAGASSSSASSSTVVIEKQSGDEGLLLPILSLLTYIFIYPIGFILNIVGLISGKNKGCFLSLFIVFFVIPLICLILFVIVMVCVGAAVDAGAATNL